MDGKIKRQDSLLSDEKQPLMDGGGGGESQGSKDADFVVSEVSDSFWKTRYTFILLAFLGFTNMYFMRVNISVTIIAMVSGSSVTNSNSSSSDIGLECPLADAPMSINQTIQTPVGNPDSKTFNWDAYDQGIILGSFFYGYISTQIPAGYLAEQFGGKWPILCGMALMTIPTLLTPLVPSTSSIGTALVVTLRILIGLGAGVMYPCMHVLISKWLPLNERTKWANIIWSGVNFGTIIGMPISGFLSATVGWESVYYVFGGTACLWLLAWTFLIYDSPAEHPRISANERDYIQASLAQQKSTALAAGGEGGKQQQKVPFPPFLAIFTSPPVLALVVAQFGHDWGFYTLLMETPAYLNNVLHVSLTQNGVVSAMPYLCFSVFSISSGWVTDWLMERGILSRTSTRRLALAMGLCGSGLAMVGLCLTGCDQAMATMWMCLSVGVNGIAVSGWQVNHMDLSPNYAGTLMGISSAFANLSGFLAPLLAGVVVNGNQTFFAWRMVFVINIGIYLFCALVYAVFGSGEIQPFDEIKQKPSRRDTEKSSGYQAI